MVKLGVTELIETFFYKICLSVLLLIANILYFSKNRTRFALLWHVSCSVMEKIFLSVYIHQIYCCTGYPVVKWTPLRTNSLVKNSQ